jgi:UDP-glucuronate 4-epimerase
MSRVLVTGTAGFIGFHLAQKLLAAGHQVAGFDNLNEYYIVSLKRRRHALLKGHANFRAIEGDLRDVELVNKVFHDFQPDYVVNLAAQAGVRYSLVNPYAYGHSNIEAFINVIEAAKRHKVKRFVYASSSSVYGGSPDMPYSEKQRVDTPISLYAATKRANELIAHSYTHLFGLPTCGLRFFTVYGPWGRPDMAMWIFAEKIMHGQPIPVFNHGNMKRDFTFIEDIIAGTSALVFSDNLKPYELMNIGGHRSEDLLTMIGIIEKELGRKAEVNLLPMQPGDVPESFASVDQISAAVGYHPTTTIHQGVPKFIEWYLDNPEIAAEAREARANERY